MPTSHRSPPGSARTITKALAKTTPATGQPKLLAPKCSLFGRHNYITGVNEALAENALQTWH